MINNKKDVLNEVKVCIYVGLVMLVKNCDGDYLSGRITSNPDDKELSVFITKKTMGIKSVYDIKLRIFQYIGDERINVQINVEKHTLDTNPAGTFSATQEHLIKLSPPGEKHRDTLPHPSFVVDYIGTDILGIGEQ